MHNAPSVSYPVGRCVLQRRLWLGLGALDLALMFAWAMQQPPGGVFFLAGALLLGAFWTLRPQRKDESFAVLSFEDGAWMLGERATSSPLQPGSVHVGVVKPVFDWQSTLLLKWQPSSDTLRRRTLWLWVDRSALPERWSDLRRAVYGPNR